MDRKLFTFVEIVVIAGLILAVMYFGGLFGSRPAHAPALVATVRSVTPTPAARPDPTPARPILTRPTGFIAFESTRDGNFEVYTMFADGSAQINITSHPAEDRLLGWSPDGRRVAILSDRTGWNEIYVMQTDGSSLIQLTDTKAGDTTYLPPVSWSPDGAEIAAVRTLPRTYFTKGQTFALDLIQTDGSGVTTLLQSESGLYNPSFSPDGGQLAFVSDSFGLRVARRQEPFTSQAIAANCYVFTWGPENNQVTCSEIDGIYTGQSDGTGNQRLLESAPGSVDSMVWSPDAGRLLYYRILGGALYLTSRDNPEDFSIAGTNVLPTIGLFYFIAGAASWAPDSKWFAYNSRRDGYAEIYIAHVDDTTRPLRLTADSGDNFNPQWQPAP